MYFLIIYYYKLEKLFYIHGYTSIYILFKKLFHTSKFHMQLLSIKQLQLKLIQQQQVQFRHGMYLKKNKN